MPFWYFNLIEHFFYTFHNRIIFLPETQDDPDKTVHFIHFVYSSKKSLDLSKRFVNFINGRKLVVHLMEEGSHLEMVSQLRNDC